MEFMLQLIGGTFATAVKLAAPLMAILFFLSVGLGLVARTVPQMNVFIVGFPLQIAVGLVMLALTALPAFADSGSDSLQPQMKNVQSGLRNTSTGWVEVLDSTHAEAAKGRNTAENLTGVVAGGAVGARKMLHRVGAGAIDLITFWIPKKQPLINPEKPRLE